MDECDGGGGGILVRETDGPVKRSGFNLIELLVVMGVLALLGALAAPAVREAIDTSRAAACASNLRQMHVAFALYLEDHENRLFPFMERVGGQRLWYWGLEMGHGAEGQRILDRSQARLAPYLPEGSVELCPSFPYRDSLTKQKYAVSSYGYGINHYLLLNKTPPGPQRITHFSSVTRPGETILWGDSAQINTFQTPASPQNPMIEEWYYLSHQEPTYHFRHGGNVQAVMCDGAVRRLPPDRLLPQCDGRIGHLEPPGENQCLAPLR